MLKRNLVAALTLAVGLGWGAIALTQEGDPLARDAQRIADLVKQLGSSKFAEREKAKKELEAIGNPALEALRKATKDENLETVKRAQELLRKIEDRMLTADLLNPKKIRINVKDQPAMDVVAELSRLSGYQIQVIGDRAAIAEKKITLDTGDVTFWEALDQVCAKGGLSEQVNVGMTTPPFIRPPIFRPPIMRPPLKVRPLPAPVLPIPGGVLPNGVVPGAAPADRPVAPPPVPDVPPAVQPEKNGAAEVVGFVADKNEPAEKPVAPKAEPGAPGGMGGAGAPGGMGGVGGAPGGMRGVGGRGIAVPGVVIGPVQVLPAVPPMAVPPMVIPPMGGGAPGFPGIGIGPIGPDGMPAHMQLIAGKHEPIPTSYSGSVRIRALTGKHIPADMPKAAGINVILDAAGEPRLQSFQLIGNPVITKAVDDQGQELSVSADLPKVDVPIGAPDGVMILPFPGPGGMMGPRSKQQTVVFNKGAKPSKMIKELTGTVTAQVVIPNEVLAKVDKVMDAAGKTVNAANGGSITIDGVEKQGDGSYKIKVKLDNMQPNPFGGMGGGIVINGGIAFDIGVGPGGVVGGPAGTGASRGLPDLEDAKGNKYQFAGVASMRTNVNGGMISQEATCIYRPAAGAGDPARLVMYGNRSVNFQVPFSFKDVPVE